MTPNASSAPERTRADIEATRAELGATVQALPARTNVKDRSRDRALGDRLGGIGSVARRHAVLVVVAATVVGLVVTTRRRGCRP
ncbi:DUF3618 domain-containing protein [Micromonospora sp. C31]|uniref:DUF3618 domain-containing protein n=1 Tax=Micromonospora sp. C31 TaxID=2824876 RepID=UPI001B39CBB3|nr:DUF3618 domain-containing protein [Micromonospora sp. C31]MBQ1075405.1 DUF3618 domain-containing protein [Micromonospora sp. C31]